MPSAEASLATIGRSGTRGRRRALRSARHFRGALLRRHSNRSALACRTCTTATRIRQQSLRSTAQLSASNTRTSPSSMKARCRSSSPRALRRRSAAPGLATDKQALAGIDAVCPRLRLVTACGARGCTCPATSPSTSSTPACTRRTPSSSTWRIPFTSRRKMPRACWCATRFAPSISARPSAWCASTSCRLGCTIWKKSFRKHPTSFSSQSRDARAGRRSAEELHRASLSAAA